MQPEDERTTAQAEELLSRLRHATLGEFEILDEAGRGGMAVVYLAHDIALDRRVAIKVISPDVLWMGEGITERLRREARVSASLSHPHIIPIYAVKESEDLFFFVMKFVRGRTLGEVMKEVGPLPASMVHTILTQVGGALGYAHRNGVVHRDVKPANIMLDEEGWAVVTDFGIAKAATTAELTLTGNAVGTPAYMSPEQCSGLPVTGASDQYALGVVAYEMLTGHRPFDAGSAMAIMYKHLNVLPEPLDVALPDCPPAIAQAVIRMLEKEPRKRWPQLEDMVAALGAVPQGESNEVRTQMLKLARSTSARAILGRFRTPVSPAPPSRSPERPTGPMEAGPPGDSSGPIPPPVRERGPWLRLLPLPPGRLAWITVPLVMAVALVLWAPWQGAEVADVMPVPLGPDEGATSPSARSPVVEVELVPPSRTLSVGDTAGFTLWAWDGDRSLVDVDGIVWFSLDPEVAVVSGDGMVTAIGPGTAEIRAAGGGRAATVQVTVTHEVEPPVEAPPPRATVASVSLTPASGSLKVGETLALEATPRDGEGTALDDRLVSWSSSDEGVVRVSDAGVVSAVGPGSAHVTARIEGRTQGVTVTVTEVPMVESVEVTPGLRTLVAGEFARLTASVRDREGRLLTERPVTWRSSDERVATVSTGGDVTAVSPGSARVTAESAAVTGFAEIVVEAAPPPAEVDPRPAIESVVGAYARALEQQDLAGARRLYPAMTNDVADGWARFFSTVRDLRVTMTIRDMEVAGDVAHARVEMTLEFRAGVRQRETSEVPMTLRQEGGVWRIVDIR
jgi:serine/threonine protein kinase/uncharacterized protein YjdB